MSEFIPIRDRLLVQKIKDDLKTKSGLIVSEDAQERPTKGTVLSVGEGKLADDGKLLPMVVSAGMTIVYPKYAGHPIKLNNEEYLILDESEVLGIIKESNSNG
jgi:chaperonin GroES